MSNSYRYSTSGFTLVELLIYVAILSIVIGGFVSFSFSLSGIRDKSNVISIVQADNQLAWETITQKVRSAQSIVFPLPGDTASQLILAPAVGQPLIIFQLNNGQLEMIESGVSTTTVTSRQTIISNLVFTGLSGGSTTTSLRFGFTGNYYRADSASFNYQQSFQTAVGLRQ